MNYQLARTNINLSGQLKWDLILNPVDGNLTIADFHLTPISNYIPYNYQQKENILNYSHIENIKKLYNKIPKYFFKNITEPQFTTGYPLQNNDKPMKAFDDTYLCGLKRVKYSQYQKQLAYFCPVWVESAEDLKNMRFCINIFNDTVYKDINSQLKHKRLTILKKYIDFNKFDNPACKIHNTFIDYLLDFTKECNLNDDLCSLKFTLGESYIKGINVEHGVPKIKDTSYVLNNILDRERPLLEFDNMLTQQFSSNKMIAPQLFNFNFYFDVDDLLSTYTNYMGEGFMCEMFVEVKNKNGKYEKIEFKDFFNNYEQINKMTIFDLDSEVNDNFNYGNCLDYLQDYRCIDFIDKNKINPQTCHWALLDNNDYIFQLYDGFAPVFVNNDNIASDSSHKFFDTPDVWDEIYNFTKNNLNWCRLYKDNLDFSDLANVEKITIESEDIYTDFDLTRDDVCWANSLKYNLTDIKNKFKLKQNLIKVLLTQTSYDPQFEEVQSQLRNGDWVQLYKDNIYVYYHIDKYNDNVIYLLVTDTNNIKRIPLSDFTFKGFLKLLNKCDENTLPNILYDLKLILNNLIKPTFIFFNKSVVSKPINYPDKYQMHLNNNKDEITYYKNDTYFNYIIRYDGKIRPCFISTNNKYKYFNYFYFYKNNNDKVFNELFNKYTLTKFEPKYPSRNYFAIDKFQIKNLEKPTISQYDILDDKTAQTLYCLKDGQKYEDYIYEWKWFNYNKFLFLHPSINFLISENEKLSVGNIDELMLLIKKKIKELYKTTDDKTDYILSQYDIKYDYEYKELDNLDDYIYKINLKLK